MLQETEANFGGRLSELNTSSETSTGNIQEELQLRARLDFADSKIKALTIFASKCDDALWLLGERLGPSVEDCAAITNGADNAVMELRDEFPSLEPLITRHEDPEELRETAGLTN